MRPISISATVSPRGHPFGLCPDAKRPSQSRQCLLQQRQHGRRWLLIVEHESIERALQVRIELPRERGNFGLQKLQAVDGRAVTGSLVFVFREVTAATRPSQREAIYNGADVQALGRLWRRCVQSQTPFRFACGREFGERSAYRPRSIARDRSRPKSTSATVLQ